MSYCVNCGVELDKSAKKCALCSTPVINPNMIDVDIEEKPFSENLNIPAGIKKKFISFVVTVAMLIPNIVMFFINVFFLRNGFWSLYVVLTSFLVWILFVLPFCMKKKNPYVLWLLGTASVLGYVYFFVNRFAENAHVTKSIFAVAAVSAVAILFLIAYVYHRKKHWTSVTAFIFAEITVAAFLSGSLVSMLARNYDFFIVGVVISVCSVIMLGFFVYCNRSKSVQAWLNKVFNA